MPSFLLSISLLVGRVISSGVSSEMVFIATMCGLGNLWKYLVVSQLLNLLCSWHNFATPFTGKLPLCRLDGLMRVFGSDRKTFPSLTITSNTYLTIEADCHMSHTDILIAKFLMGSLKFAPLWVVMEIGKYPGPISMFHLSPIRISVWFSWTTLLQSYTTVTSRFSMPCGKMRFSLIGCSFISR